MKLIAVVLAGCCVVAAQPTFRSGVELVTIDVVATDRSGRPVHDLKAADFELFEDGKSVPIKAFQYIDSSIVPRDVPLPVGGGILFVITRCPLRRKQSIRGIRLAGLPFFTRSRHFSTLKGSGVM